MKSFLSTGNQALYPLETNKQWPGASILGSFKPGRNKTMLVFFSGSGWVYNSGIIQVELRFNGKSVMELRTYSNEPSSHKSLIPVNFLYALGDDDDINYEIRLIGATQADYNDWFNLFVIVYEKGIPTN